MKNQRSLVQVVLFAILFTFSFGFSQTEKELKLLLMQKQGNVNLSELNLTKFKSNTDTIAKLDTLAKKSSNKHYIDSIKEYSTYETIVRGKVVHPNKILSSITVFGHDVFRMRNRQLTLPNNQTAVPSSYILSAGDEINISMWGRINDNYKFRISRNGTITIPRIGQINLAGSTFNMAQKNIISKIENIEGVNASVSIGTLSNISIFVVGEVNNPGQFVIPALSSVIDAIFLSGGFRKNGSMRAVTLKRNGKTVKTFDFYDFLIDGKNSNYYRLKSGDVIHVPIAKSMATIAGNVRRSAIYELKGATSLKKLIALSGGLTPTAFINRIQIERFENFQEKVVSDIEIFSITDLPNIDIVDGDIIKIFPIVKMDHNAIHLLGNVYRPGKYEYKDGMKISDIITSFDQLLPETYFNYATLRRYEPPTYIESIVPFNLSTVINEPESKDNITLQPLDKIMIYNRDFFDPDRTVSINGAVTKSDTFILLENMRIKDLILEAGGLLNEASIDRGEIYKRLSDGDNIKTEKITFSVEKAMNNDPNHNLLLNKFDHIYIRKKRGWEEQRKVALLGEFNYPGEYIILENESLGELIERAGGFKKEAYIDAAIFTRESVKKIEDTRSKEYALQLENDISNATAEMAASGADKNEMQAILTQQQAMLKKIRNIKSIGRIVIDFSNEENYTDLCIENNDTLYIPKNSSLISVIGEVFNPATFVMGKKGYTVDHCIQQAGGFKELANKKNSYVIKSNGSVLTRKMVRIKKYVLSAGDVIVVPKKIPYNNGRFKMFMNTLDVISKLSAITANTLSTIYIVRQMK